MSSGPRSEEPSLFANLMRGRGRVIAAVVVLLGLGLSCLLAYVAMRAPAVGPAVGHVSGPR